MFGIPFDGVKAQGSINCGDIRFRWKANSWLVQRRFARLATTWDRRMEKSEISPHATLQHAYTGKGEGDFSLPPGKDAGFLRFLIRRSLPRISRP
jgi:hypothetical protein